MTERRVEMYNGTLSVIEGKVEAENIGRVIGNLVSQGYEISSCHQFDDTVFLKMVKKMAKG